MLQSSDGFQTDGRANFPYFSQDASLKAPVLRLMERVGLSARSQNHVTPALARLGRDDLYLLHNIRAPIDPTLDRLESRTQILKSRGNPESRSDD